ncbi:hypothetical protein CHS0354_037629 [Potamilus streckersoni]|uniref:Uncharacterized protein n=1 Tax=Potamilus streckersoni TaxID=2493646 RepID=A0AAE0T549_9BIVA|nr:hypothetical protein CHS0354_037629 [Potamilus streckersoni]
MTPLVISTSGYTNIITYVPTFSKDIVPFSNTSATQVSTNTLPVEAGTSPGAEAVHTFSPNPHTKSEGLRTYYNISFERRNGFGSGVIRYHSSILRDTSFQNKSQY